MKGQSVTALQVSGLGVATVVGTSTGSTAIPLMAGGERARFVAVNRSGTDTIYINPGDSSVGAALGASLLLGVNTTATILNVSGQTHIAHISVAGGDFLNICPLANQ